MSGQDNSDAIATEQPADPADVKQKGPSSNRPWWVWLLGLFFAGAILFVLVIPAGVRYGAKAWLQEQGADQVRIGEVEISPFRGMLGVRDVFVQEGEHPPLVIDAFSAHVRLRSLFSRKIELENVHLSGATLTAQIEPEQPVRVGIQFPAGGEEQEPEETGGEPWGFGIGQTRIENSRFAVVMPDFEGEWAVDDLALHDLISWEPGGESRFALNSSVNGAPVAVDGLGQVFHENQRVEVDVEISGLSLAPFAGLAGDAIQSVQGELSAQLKVGLMLSDGKIEVAPVGTIGLTKFRLVDASGNPVSADIEWNGDIKVLLAGENVDLNLLGNLQIKQLNAAQKDQQVSGDIRWDGSAKVAIAGAKTSVQATGKLGLNALQAQVPDYQIDLATGNWKGTVSVGIDGDQIDLNTKGDLSTAAISILDQARQTRLFRAKGVDVQGVAVESLESVQVAAVRVDGAVGLEPRANGASGQLFRAGRVDVADVRYMGDSAAIGFVTIGGASIDLQRTEAGGFAYLDPYMQEGAGSSQAGEAASKPAAADSKPFRIQLGQLNVGEESRLNFSDASVAPTYRTSLLINELKVDNVDTGDANAKTGFSVKALQDGYGQFISSGSLYLNQSPVSGSIDADLKSIELPPLSPYAMQAIGYQLNTGQLDLKTRVQINKGALDGNNEIELRALELTRQDATRAEQLANQLTMPLNSALSLLRDKKGNIELEIPISGNLEKPDVGLQDVINTVMAKAVKAAAFSYVKAALQPYGTLITVAEVATKAGKKMALRLEPVAFLSGSAELSKGAQGYLQKVAELLRDRPDTTIRLCGISSNGDRAALAGKGEASEGEAPLLQLADTRSGVVKSYLAVDHGIAVDRLFSCVSRILLNEAPGVHMEMQ